jgi:Uma2 family endonuclease
MSAVLQAAPASPGADDVPTEPVVRLSVKQYHEMINAGILGDGDPVELLEGWLVLKMPKKPSHSSVTRLVRKALLARIPPGWYVDSQEPVTTADSEPEPDLLVMRGDESTYLTRHPRPKDVALVVEVSDVTLHRDRTLKKRIYSRAKIPVYWIVNLIDGHVEVYTGPTGPGDRPDYRRRRDYGRDDELPLVIGRREVGRLAVRELLPKDLSSA